MDIVTYVSLYVLTHLDAGKFLAAQRFFACELRMTVLVSGLVSLSQTAHPGPTGSAEGRLP